MRRGRFTLIRQHMAGDEGRLGLVVRIQSFFGFEETLHLSQLAKEHRDELVPDAQAARGALALARVDHSFKNGARDLPKNSTEMMDTLAVGGAPRLGRIVLAGTPFYGNRPPPSTGAISDTS